MTNPRDLIAQMVDYLDADGNYSYQHRDDLIRRAREYLGDNKIVTKMVAVQYDLNTKVGVGITHRDGTRTSLKFASKEELDRMLDALNQQVYDDMFKK